MKKKQSEQTRLYNKYPYILAWGKMMGSFDYYIIEQCRRAEQDNAGENATYYNDTRQQWVRLADVHPDTQKTLNAYKPV